MGKAENDRLQAPGEASPSDLSSREGGKEQRRETRYMVSWRAAVSVDGQNFHYGRLKDISLHGAAVLNDFNVKPGTRITLKIHIPTLNLSRESKVMMVSGVTAYAVYDTDRRCFRIGISFVRFEHASDSAYLEERLTNYHVKVPDYVCRRSTDR